MEYHPFASIFPMFGDDRLAELAESIRNNGLRNPLVIFEGKVLDGRNRATACLIAGVEPECEQFRGDGAAALKYVWDQNANRRDLTGAQRVASYKKRELMEAELAATTEALKAEADSRKRSGKFTCDCGEQFDRKVWHCPSCDHHWPIDRNVCGNCGADLSQKVGKGGSHSNHSTDAHRAKLAGSNRQYIHDIDKIAAAKPELVDEIAAGKKTMAEAKREIEPAKKRTKKRRPADVTAQSRRAIQSALTALTLALEVAGILKEFDADLQRMRDRIGS